jgi:cellulose synthase/poly-beta-1,6-N-acetylglucosamine synthase-like glycosyltransferase
VSTPRISVVVPVYNVERYVRQCLASICAQTLADWECIVVDDGSTDATAERVRQVADPRISLIVQPNRGVSSARNAGLFLDGDDMLHPAALARLSAALDAHPQAVAAYGTAWLVFEDGRPYPQKALHRRAASHPSGNVLARMIRENVLLVGMTMLRTATGRELGGFHTRLRLGEDWEFWCRLAARGEFRFIGTEPEVSRIRVRSGSASGLLSHAWENHLPTVEAIVSNPALAAQFTPARWRRMTRQVVASHLWEAGRMNFTARRHAEARRLMLRALAKDVTAKRLALFAIAQASQLLGVSLYPRLRFVDEDL